MDREKEYVWTRLHFFQFDENNPKEHNYSEIENSIKRFGFLELPVVNKVTNTLVQDINAATQNLLGTGFDLEDIMQMEEFQNAPLKFDEDFGKEVHYVKVEADSAEHAESIKAQLKELGFICQVKSITK